MSPTKIHFHFSETPLKTLPPPKINIESENDGL